MIAHAAAPARGANDNAESRVRQSSISSSTVSTYARARMCRASSRAGELLDPWADIVAAEGGQPFDIALLSRRKDDAHGREVFGCHSATPEHDMDECASRAPVTVVERVNRLELRVHECRLHNGWKAVVVDGVTKVVEQRAHVLGWRRHEIGAARVVVVSSDPVLPRADPPGDGSILGALHEALVDGNDVIEAEALRGQCVLHGEHHCIYVRKDLDGQRARLLSRLDAGFGARELARAELHPFHFGRRSTRSGAAGAPGARARGAPCR